MSETKKEPPLEEYPHRLRWDRMGRKGQCCKILNINGTLSFVHVQFEDGHNCLIERRALTRRGGA
jgi:hypothetical protein